jgi:hypothetical protein
MCMQIGFNIKNDIEIVKEINTSDRDFAYSAPNNTHAAAVADYIRYKCANLVESVVRQPMTQQNPLCQALYLIAMKDFQLACVVMELDIHRKEGHSLLYLSSSGRFKINFSMCTESRTRWTNFFFVVLHELGPVSVFRIAAILQCLVKEP